MIVTEMAYNRRPNILSLREQPKLMKAIVKKDKLSVTRLIENEEDVNRCDVDRRTPLHLAAALGCYSIVELLIESGARVNARDNDWVSPVHRACRNNRDEIVSLLLANGADANTRDRQWITPMHVCAANNGLECARLLLPRINSIDTSDRMGCTPLHHSVYNSHLDLTTFLLTNKAQANAFDKCERRPIHYAAVVDNTDAIRFLVEKGGAEVNVHDKDLMTPLHMAAAKGSINALQLLLDLGAKIDAIDAYGNSVVHWASIYGQDDILDELILRGAYLGCVNHNGITPLHLAAASSLGASALDVLTIHKTHIDVNSRDKYGRTPLHFAAKYGGQTRISDLIRCGADPNIVDKWLATPLHYASLHGHTSIVDTLLSIAKADVNLIDTNGMSPLHYSSFAGISSATKRLLASNANSQICDTCGRTAHFLAAYSGNIECLQSLMPLPERLKDASNRSLLHYASSAHNSECLELLLRNFREKFNINERDINGMTALHFACAQEEDDNQCVNLLLEFGAKADIPDNNGYLCLHYAAANGNTSAVQSLILSFDWKDVKMIVSPTHCAAFYGRQEALQLLMEMFYHDIGQALEYAIFREHNICVKIILDFLIDNPSLKFISHIINQSLLVSAQFAFRDTLNVFLNYIKNIDITDNRGRTPLMLAALNESGADCVELLLKRNANPNAIDFQKRSPLFYAIYANCEESVKSLLLYGALPQNRCLNGKSAYHFAASIGHYNILWNLLNANPNLTPEALTDNEGLTPIHWATLKSQNRALSTLLEFETLKQFKGNKTTPLHLAAFSSSIECFQSLLSHYGIESLLLMDNKNRSILHFACMANAYNMTILDILVSNGVDIDSVDSAGQTPLMYASKRGLIETVEYLLSKGANVKAIDNKQNNALQLSCIYSREECGIKLLKSCHSLVNSVNGDLKTPLHISAANGLVKLTQELLLTGASVNVVDAEGLTPSLCCAKNSEVGDCLMLIESIMLIEVEPQNLQQSRTKSLCDMESASTLESRQSIIKRKSAQISCDNNTPDVSLNNVSEAHNSSDSDFY
ncbi:serine/threonine-protein phosphatase 6 regulatory ankyrin repeat subunit A-like [Oppia nitens]|uniref:serine/threonine-protein phosphatase 6 regulatory ankyrin repeat subunit A-like n=1 Tax=Oppia nitens TaxID=1686743 RepID=UPI0023DAF8AB|nr:serine/threonine-protein phosphatase 6 regulatory ankyrin repeat subunit A-like [Oppia nitens]